MRLSDYQLFTYVTVFVDDHGNKFIIFKLFHN